MSSEPQEHSARDHSTSAGPRSLSAAWASIRAIGADATTLLKLYVELAKTEMRASAKALGVGIGLSLIAIGLILLAAIFILIGAAYLINSAGLPLWAGFLIVGGGVFIVVAILAVMAKWQFGKVTLPDRTIAALSELTAEPSPDNR